MAGVCHQRIWGKRYIAFLWDSILILEHSNGICVFIVDLALEAACTFFICEGFLSCMEIRPIFAYFLCDKLRIWIFRAGIVSKKRFEKYGSFCTLWGYIKYHI